MRLTTKLIPIPILLALALAAAGCGGSGKSATNASATTSSGGASGGAKLSLVAYSTPQEAYKALIPAFNQTAAGRGVSFAQSYGPSGDQSRAVAAGLPADVVEFSLQPDMTKLVKAGLVASDWNAGPHHGFVTDSVVALVVRKGNPKHITGWSDLVKPGIQVVTPNVFTSGSARWNVLAGYGAQLKQGSTPAQAQQWLSRLYHNVVAQPSSGRNALQTFTGGKGDVLISYENEAITAQHKGQAVDYVIPRQTILIQNPIAVVSKSSHQAQAKAFVSWLTTPAAQKIWASKGYRPVIPSLVDPKRFPTPPQLFTIDYLGGWDKVMKQFFDPTSGTVAKIEQQLGVSTGG